MATGDYLFFVDDDNYLKLGAISVAMEVFRRWESDGVAVVGMTACYADRKMLIADGGSQRFYTSGFMWGERTNERVYRYNWFMTARFRTQHYYPVSEVANAFIVQREAFLEAGGFDEVNFPIDLDEADLCKRIKNIGYDVVMAPFAICYHKSVTYSCVPDFRRPMNAYFMGRNRILYQRKHLNRAQLLVYWTIFFPIFFFGYAACLIYRRKPSMVLHFTKGVLDGILGRKKNKYQS